MSRAHVWHRSFPIHHPLTGFCFLLFAFCLLLLPSPFEKSLSEAMSLCFTPASLMSLQSDLAQPLSDFFSFHVSLRNFYALRSSQTQRYISLSASELHWKRICPDELKTGLKPGCRPGQHRRSRRIHWLRCQTDRFQHARPRIRAHPSGMPVLALERLNTPPSFRCSRPSAFP